MKISQDIPTWSSFTPERLVRLFSWKSLYRFTLDRWRWLSRRDFPIPIASSLAMRECQDNKKCIPSGGIIHVVPFFNSRHSSRKVFSLLRFLQLSPLSPYSIVCVLSNPPTPSVGMLATLLLVCTLLKITVINGELQQLVEPP